jgi:hypothetical protein
MWINMGEFLLLKKHKTMFLPLEIDIYPNSS